MANIIEKGYSFSSFVSWENGWLLEPRNWLYDKWRGWALEAAEAFVTVALKSTWMIILTWPLLCQSGCSFACRFQSHGATRMSCVCSDLLKLRLVYHRYLAPNKMGHKKSKFLRNFFLQKDLTRLTQSQGESDNFQKGRKREVWITWARSLE